MRKGRKEKRNEGEREATKSDKGNEEETGCEQIYYQTLAVGFIERERSAKNAHEWSAPYLKLSPHVVDFGRGINKGDFGHKTETEMWTWTDTST